MNRRGGGMGVLNKDLSIYEEGDEREGGVRGTTKKRGWIRLGGVSVCIETMGQVVVVVL